MNEWDGSSIGDDPGLLYRPQNILISPNFHLQPMLWSGRCCVPSRLIIPLRPWLHQFFNCRIPSPQSIVLKLFPAKKSILSLFGRLLQRQVIPKSEEPCSDGFSKEKGVDKAGTNRDMTPKGLRGRHKRQTDFTTIHYGSDILVQLLSLSFQQMHPTKAPHRASTGNNRPLTKQVDFLLSIYPCINQASHTLFTF